MKKVILATFMGVLIAMPLMAQKKKQKKKTDTEMEEKPLLQNKIDTASYAFGVSLAKDLKNRGLRELNAKAVAKAIEDVFTDSTLLLAENDMMAHINDVLSAATEELKKEQMSAGQEFLAANAKNENIQTTSSGLQYEVLREGDGAKPASPSDEVTVHYKGALIDGKVFDSSYDRNETISFRLDRVIKGWTEGLQLMPVGSHYRFFIPYDLGYGERGAGNDIPPYSTLVFDVELFKINGQ